MPIYEYKAMARAGKLKAGIVDADTPKDARTKLRAEGIHVVELAQIEKKDDKSLLMRYRSANLTDLAMVTRQLGTMIEADIPLRDALGVLVEQLEDRNMQMVFRDVRERLTSGTSFADSLAEHPRFFSDLYVHMVRAGEAAGNLDAIFSKLADYLQAQSRLRGRVSAALVYPILMMIVGTCVVTFLMIFVVPRITKVLTAQKQELPLPTYILKSSSDFLLTWWWLILLGIIAVIVGWLVFLSKPIGRRFYDWLRISIPIVGSLFKKQAVSRFSITFSTLLQSGIPALEALRIVTHIVDNVFMAETLEEVQKTIIEGGDMATPLRKSKFFPPMVGYMISVGEQSGRLESILTRVADTYDQEVEITTQKVTSLLEPIMIIALSFVVGFIVISMILPLMQMSQGVK